MTAIIDNEDHGNATESRRPCKLTELVRGSDRRLVDEMTPIVRNQTVSLDLGSVERIDAAGIAALISLYRAAHEAGHGFKVANVCPRVRELLVLVGLEGILVSDPAIRRGGLRVLHLSWCKARLESLKTPLAPDCVPDCEKPR